jgi:hypothetical protein
MKQMISFYYLDPTALVVQFFFYRPPQSPLLTIEPTTNTHSLRSLTATIMPIVWISFLLKTENSVVCKDFCDLLSREVLFIPWETRENGKIIESWNFKHRSHLPNLIEVKLSSAYPV